MAECVFILQRGLEPSPFPYLALPSFISENVHPIIFFLCSKNGTEQKLHEKQQPSKAVHQTPPNTAARQPEAMCDHPHRDKHRASCGPGGPTLHRGFGGRLADEGQSQA